MQAVTDFFSHGFFTVTGGICSLIFLAGIFIAMYQCSKGLFPVLYRLGRALNGRKIALYVESSTDIDLETLLVDSGVFKKENIKVITPSSAASGDKYSLHLVHYHSCQSGQSYLSDVLKNVKSGHALLIYAPQNEGFIPKDHLEEINKKQNVVVVNFKGRLLNDLLNAMITTSFQKK